MGPAAPAAVVIRSDPDALEISRREARALLASPLGPAGPGRESRAGGRGLDKAFSRTRVIQMDPVRRVAESHHLSLALRVGGYRPAILEAAEREARIVEVRAHERSLVPIGDLPLYMPRMRLARIRLQGEEARVAGAIREVLDRLEREGPLPSRAFAAGPASRVEGFWDRPGEPRTQAAALALEVLWDEGRVAVFRDGGTRFYDLPERRWPASMRDAGDQIDAEEARRGRLLAYLAATGLADRRGARVCLDRSTPGQRATSIDWATRTGRAVAVRVSGDGDHAPVPGLLALRERLEALGPDARPPGSRRSRLLPPLDNLLWQRDLVRDLLGLSYRWEVYIPEARRTIGPYGMPLWTGDTLSGQVDAFFDRSSGRLTGRFYPPARTRVADRKRDVRAAEWALADLAGRLARVEGRPVSDVFLAMASGTQDGGRADPPGLG